MDNQFREGCFVLGMGAVDLPVYLKLIQSQVAWPIMAVGEILECFHDVLVSALTKQELWRLVETDDQDSSNAQDKDKSTAGVE